MLGVWSYPLVLVMALVVTLILTPLVREMNRSLGMVDKPDPRRINKVPIPRGGGLAIVIGVLVPYMLFHYATGRPLVQGISDLQAHCMVVLSVLIALLGLADDKFSLRPRVKLLGQVIIAALVWFWADLGFGDLWPWLPKWFDCAITVFWIVGAVNAFNLIDGLDGLASGLALIAIVGMAGGLFFVQNPQATLFYFAMMGGLIGFLRYNYNPASVFLGDCGSMFIGFIVGTLPLASHEPNSLLVSVGVPLLAMGVPIFDTALAILRRTLRRLINHRVGSSNSSAVMTADSDHLHHRILRSVGLDQRKAAWVLYLIAASCIGIGWVAMYLQSRSGGLWLAAVALAAYVIFKDSKIELFDAGVLLNAAAHPDALDVRRRLASWSVPFYVVVDLLALSAVFVACTAAFGLEFNRRALRAYLPVRVAATFIFLVLFRTYRTVWSRALGSNFVRLLMACIFGAVAGSVFMYYWPNMYYSNLCPMTIAHAFLAFVVLGAIRLFRNLVRDLFYALDCSRLKMRKDVSRVLVYGAGLRYRAFRRELVRTTAANDRMIVGLIDDDVFLKGRYIGGIRIFGNINEAPDVINRLNVDSVVIACDFDEKWMQVVKQILAPTGVKVTQFKFEERAI